MPEPAAAAVRQQSFLAFDFGTRRVGVASGTAALELALRAVGVGPVTEDVCREYIKHMEALIFGGMLAPNKEKAPA